MCDQTKLSWMDKKKSFNSSQLYVIMERKKQWFEYKPLIPVMWLCVNFDLSAFYQFFSLIS